LTRGSCCTVPNMRHLRQRKGSMMINKTLRRAVPAALLTAVVLAVAEPAYADYAVDLPQGTACADFGLRLESVGGDPLVREFRDENGDVVRTISVGSDVVLTYTNLGPDSDPVVGKSVTIKTAGSVSRTVTNPDGTKTVTSTGHNGLILFPTDVPAGPTTTQYIGIITYTVDTAGVFTLLSTKGQQRDICAELA
jgi:hypothetical protein